MSKTTQERAAVAELVETLVRDHADTVENVVRGLVKGRLRGYCTDEELAGWHRSWKRRQRAAETWHQSPEIPVDPATLEQGTAAAVEEAAGEAEPEPDPVAEAVEETAEAAGSEARPGEIAGGMLRMMDRRLLREDVRWKESGVALQEGEIKVSIRRGAGREQAADGSMVEWVAYAVLTLFADGRVSRIFPECVFRGLREPGWKRTTFGLLRLCRAELVRQPDSGGTSQAVGTLLLLYKGQACGCKTHAEVAEFFGKSRANGSAKARRMAEEDMQRGGHAAFAVLRSRETVGHKHETKQRKAKP